MAVFKLFIGGPSQSGKTTCAKLVRDHTGFDHVNLDKDREILEIKKKFPFQAKRKLQQEERSERLRSRALEIIKNLKVNSVIEGSRFKPDDMEMITKGEPYFFSAFCAYPNADALQKLEAIEASGFKDASHLRRLSEQDRVIRIRNYIKTSQKIEASCLELGIPFFDFSDMTTISLQQHNLSDSFFGPGNTWHLFRILR